MAEIFEEGFDAYDKSPKLEEGYYNPSVLYSKGTPNWVELDQYFPIPKLWDRIKQVFRPTRSETTVYTVFHFMTTGKEEGWKLAESFVDSPTLPGKIRVKILRYQDGELMVDPLPLSGVVSEGDKG